MRSHDEVPVSFVSPDSQCRRNPIDSTLDSLVNRRSLCRFNLPPASHALELLRHNEYDLVMIDLHLPDIFGHDVVRRMRATGIDIPVLMVADTATTQQATVALDHGADGFMIVPCDPHEVLARMRAIVRRSHGHVSSTLRWGPVDLSLDRHELRV
jgi:two-component system, cell cycle response regulator CtrA